MRNKSYLAGLRDSVSTIGLKDIIARKGEASPVDEPGMEDGEQHIYVKFTLGESRDLPILLDPRFLCKRDMFGELVWLKRASFIESAQFGSI